jgi:antitoxin PrlF
MAIAQSKLTAQGQISVPAEVRRRLGPGPGAVLEWEELGDEVVVRKAGRHRSVDVHEALFGTAGVPAAGSADVKEAIRLHVRRRHARG